MTIHVLKKPPRAKKHKTAADKARFNAIFRSGCVVCKTHFGVYTPPQIHHCFTGMGRRKDHAQTIGLCLAHHTDGPISIHNQPQEFETYFGTEAELLAKVNEILEKMG